MNSEVKRRFALKKYVTNMVKKSDIVALQENIFLQCYFIYFQSSAVMTFYLC